MPEITPTRYMVQAGWDSVPHLDEATKTQLLRSTLPHLRDARSKGDPSMGAGVIYPIPLSEWECEPFPIPATWPRCYSLDVGWRKTAALWAAVDPGDGCAYLYAEHYRGQAEPSAHATAIRARGEWIPGCVDPAARGREKRDGEQLIATYRALGLKLTEADHSVEAGLEATWQRLVEGRYKHFRTLQNFRSEYRLYRRDEKGRIVKEHDHLMDNWRYLTMTGLRLAKTQPVDGRSLMAPTTVMDRDAGY